MNRVDWVLLLSLVVAACDGGSSTDAGADGGTVADAGADAWAFDPAPPVLTPCRAGWREVPGENGGVACDPWPDTGRRDDCAMDEAHFPGTPGCVRVGTACPADGWPADLPSGRRVVYVDAAAATGGDGTTHARAFAKIGDAADASPPGAIIAVAAGHYDEGEIYVGPGMTLWGACVAGTEIGSTSASPSHGVVFLAENGSEARNLRVESPSRLGIVALGTPSTVTDVVVHGAMFIGIATSDGVLALDHVVVSGTHGGAGARALEVQMTGHATVAVARFDDGDDTGIVLEGASAGLDASDLAVTRVHPRADGTRGDALSLLSGARATVSAAVFEDLGEYGVYLQDTGTMLTATDLVVRRNVSPAATAGVFVTSGAAVQLSRALIEHAQGAALAVENSGTHLEVADAVLRDLREDATQPIGRGIDILDGAAVVADRVVVARALDGAISCAGPGATLDARDLLLTDILGTASGEFGRGINAFAGGVATVERVVVVRAHDLGVIASQEGSSLDAHGLVVREMLGRVNTGDYGQAVWAEIGAHVTVTDALVDGARLAGVGAIEGGVVTLERTTVRNTLVTACATTTCPALTGGFAIAAPYGGVVTATDFLIDGAAVCGVVVGEATPTSGAASVDLHHGVISTSPVGACVQADGYDSARLRDDVAYRDVGVPLQATSYMLPGAVGGL